VGPVSVFSLLLHARTFSPKPQLGGLLGLRRGMAGNVIAYIPRGLCFFAFRCASNLYLFPLRQQASILALLF
jgi:hypothetical protein